MSDSILTEASGTLAAEAKKSTESHEAVTAVLRTKTELDHVVQALENRGFRKSDVSVVMPVTSGRQDVAFEKETKAYKFGAIGGVIGLAIGLFYGWLGLGGWVNVPGAEFVAEHAPWMVFGTAASVGVFVGGVVGALIGCGTPEYVTRLYEKSVKGGTMLVAVHVDDPKWKQRAIDILKHYRARDIAANKTVV